MKEQAEHIYRKVESGDIINVDTLKQETEQQQQLSRIDDINLYGEVIVKNAGNNVINYIQYETPKEFS